MWRSLFVSIGIMAVIFGIECLFIESATLYGGSASDLRASSFLSSGAVASTREWRPQEWFPWAVISAGVVTVIYAFTLPQRWNSGAAG
jgi:hypothetical protein